MEDDEKVVPFRGAEEPVTPTQVLLEALQEVREFPIKTALILLMDENDVASIWRTDMTEAQLCKCQMEVQMHTINQMVEAQMQRD